MNIWYKTAMAVVAASTILSAPVAAQSDEELQQRAREAEMRLAEQEMREAAEARRAEETARAQEMREAVDARRAEMDRGRTEQHAVELRMREAEQRLAEAARQVADLSMAQLPRVERLERVIRASRGPMLGISIDADEDSGPVEGIELLGVSPGGAAEEAGLRAGDVITSVNGESLTADNSNSASSKLLDFMQGVETGDKIDVEYLRDGKSHSATLTPRPMGNNVFAFDFGGKDFVVPDVHVAPNVRQFSNFVWHSDDGFGAMELAPLSERLGSYFGTSEGLLVVSAPADDELQLEDGDVILNIDGRKPTSVAHAMRILGSYESGEELEIEIMRDKRKRTIKLTIPDNRRSWAAPSVAPLAPVAPAAEAAVQKVIVIDKDRI